MNKYEKGKIYKIVNDDMPDKVYYGSCVQKYLSNRLTVHKSTLNKKYPCSSKILYEKGKPRIELVENFPCNSKKELEERERYYIENNECVNIKIPGRTQKERDAKRTDGEYRKMYYKKKITCECGSIISRGHFSEHKKTIKHKNFISSLLED